MKLEASKFKRLVAVCADCEDRSDGPRHLGSKTATKELRRLADDSPVRARVTRTRCLGICPHKALAAVALGHSLPAMTAEMESEADLRVFARYAFGSDASKR